MSGKTTVQRVVIPREFSGLSQDETVVVIDGVLSSYLEKVSFDTYEEEGVLVDYEPRPIEYYPRLKNAAERWLVSQAEYLHPAVATGVL
jgi:hypothetical protein